MGKKSEIGDYIKCRIVLVIDDAEHIFSELCDMYEDVDPFPCAQYLGWLTFKMKKKTLLKMLSALVSLKHLLTKQIPLLLRL